MERFTILFMGKSTISIAIFHSLLYVHQRVSNNTVPKWWMFMDFPLGRYRNQATPGWGSNGPFTRGPAPGPAIGFLAIGCGPGAVRLPWILGSLDWILACAYDKT